VEELEAEGHRRVVGVTRTGHARIVSPQTTLQEGDQVHLAVDEDGLQELRPRVLAARREARDQPAEAGQEARR
jgi:Trk K+ transport system NAD-binding subunit